MQGSKGGSEMIKEVIMPKLGETMEEGYLSEWKKEEGDRVEKGEVLFEVMSDKTNFEVEAQNEGYLRKKLFEAGDESIPVTTVIGYISTEKDEPLPEIKEDRETAGEKEKQQDKETTAEKDSQEKTAEKTKNEESRMKISPLAKTLAEQHGIDVSQLKGTGPEGRIKKEDVTSYLQKNKKTETSDKDRGDYYVQKWTPIRRIISKRLTESKQTIPHYYLEGNFITDSIAKLKNIKEKEGQKLTYTDFLLFTACRAIKTFPLINAAVINDEIRVYNSIDIGMAVSVKEGLMVPVIKNCFEKTIYEISEERQEIIKKAGNKQLSEEDMKEARFVISNMGMFGVDNFQPIINPPGVAIMGIGSIKKTPLVVENRLEIRSVMNISLVFDHRIIDGNYGAEFYSYFKKLMENPGLMAL
jgi:pyruvate dehydrogenase E2 component (dihydrolipoamide acetyltransferase)